MRFLPDITRLFAAVCASCVLTACNGLFDGVYDEPEEKTTVAGQLYIDASSWLDWYYIDLDAVAAATKEDQGYNTSEAWVRYRIPTEQWEAAPADTETGIYTYWYDVFGQGISKYEFRSFYPTRAQSEPENWTFAVHRNNVRTNGGAVAATTLTSLDQLPDDPAELAKLTYTPDKFNRTDVWTIQDRMLLGLIGNQGIEVNDVLSSWLKMSIPPVPPAFSMDGRVFVLRLADGTYAGLQLRDYQSTTGIKCCLTIDYRYPL